MRKLRRNRLEAKFTDQEFKYLPMFFESMISYLSYKLNRDETLQSLQNEVGILPIFLIFMSDFLFLGYSYQR